MIGVAGAGAFGTALAVALAAGGRDVRLWARNPAQRQEMRQARLNARLPGIGLPDNIEVVDKVGDLAPGPVLLAVPAQALRGFLQDEGRALLDSDLVACCKGIDLQTLTGPAEIIRRAGARGAIAVLSGPGFAADLARGLPTALTLACDGAAAAGLQHILSTERLRLYRTNDVMGAQLGGALKNVIAIAAGVAIGAGLGNSARAAVITRGYAEMLPLAVALGARPETLAGLSGLGDLVLTCTSEMSRNFSHGMAMGAGRETKATTVEGVATAGAVMRLAAEYGLDLPILDMVARLVADRITVDEAVRELMTRPLREE